MAVKIRPGESFESLMSRFKKDVAKSGILQDLKKHEYYVPPSEKKRIKSDMARKRLAKGASKN